MLVGVEEAQMMSKRRSVGWSFWFTWVLATLVGLGVGFLLLAVVAGISGDGRETVFNDVAHAVALLLGGALLGLLHYLVLQRTADEPSPALSGGALAPTAGVITGATLAGTLFGSIAPYDPVTIFLAALVGAGLGGVVARWL